MKNTVSEMKYKLAVIIRLDTEDLWARTETETLNNQTKEKGKEQKWTRALESSAELQEA